VIEMPDGRRRLEVRFRKQVFKERSEDKGTAEKGWAKLAQAARGKWRM